MSTPVFINKRNDTKDFVFRAIDNGGSLTETDINAVEYFLQAADDGGWGSQIIRAHLYLSDLEASLAPVIAKKGRYALSAGLFVQADLTANGLKGNGTTKYLDTLVQLDHIGISTGVFLSVYISELVSEIKYLMGTYDGTNPLSLAADTTNVTGYAFNFVDNQGAKSATAATGTILLNRTSATSMHVGVNESFNEATAGTIGTLPTTKIFVHATNDNGSAADFCTQRLGGFAIGFNLTTEQRNHYVQTMNYVQQTILGRP